MSAKHQGLSLLRPYPLTFELIQHSDSLVLQFLFLRSQAPWRDQTVGDGAVADYPGRLEGTGDGRSDRQHRVRMRSRDELAEAILIQMLIVEADQGKVYTSVGRERLVDVAVKMADAMVARRVPQTRLEPLIE